MKGTITITNIFPNFEISGLAITRILINIITHCIGGLFYYYITLCSPL